MLKGHLIHLVGYFGCYRILELSSSLRRREFQNISLRNLSPINEWGGGAKEKRVIILDVLNKRE